MGVASEGGFHAGVDGGGGGAGAGGGGVGVVEGWLSVVRVESVGALYEAPCCVYLFVLTFVLAPKASPAILIEARLVGSRLAIASLLCACCASEEGNADAMSGAETVGKTLDVCCEGSFRPASPVALPLDCPILNLKRALHTNISHFLHVTTLPGSHQSFDDRVG